MGIIVVMSLVSSEQCFDQARMNRIFDRKHRR